MKVSTSFIARLLGSKPVRQATGTLTGDMRTKNSTNSQPATSPISSSASAGGIPRRPSF